MSVTSQAESTSPAVADCIEQLRADLGDVAPDLLMVFFSAHHGEQAESIRSTVMAELAPGVLLGCPATGVIGSQEEVERRPGLTMLAGHWPGAALHRFAVRPVDGSETPTLDGWPDPSELPPDSDFLLITDPYAAPESVLLGDFSERYPERTLVGGVASSTAGPGFGQLITNDGVLPEGLVGVAIGGSVRVDTVVSQGCRPVGQHFVITSARRHLIQKLGGLPALDQLETLLADAEPEDRKLMQNGSLHIGRVVDERKSRFDTRDLLVRNLLGIQPEQRAIAISDHVRAGQTVQFMVRDPAAASRELRTLLDAERDAAPALGALMFSCNGRGQGFFGRPDHDIGQLQELLGPVPTAGFFAAGELGPVGGRPFLHGLTTSIALFRPR